MTAIRPNPAAPAAASASVRPAGPAAAYAERLARFDALAATVLDTSGQASEDQRLQAYQNLQTLSANGQLIGVADDRRQVLDQATDASDIGQRAQQLSKGFVQAVNAAGRQGGPAAALKAAGSALDGLPAADQNILFATTINAPDRLGARPYADIAAWRENADAQAKIVDYLQARGVVGANGRLDYRAAAARADDAGLTAAVKLSQRRDNTSPEWTRSVQQLFGAERTPDRLDLSPAAQTLVDAAPPRPTAPAPARYRTGSLISTTA